MDPLSKVEEASGRGLIPEGIAALVRKRFPVAVSGIGRIERASGIDYPAAYVDPSVLVSVQDPGSFEYGILFARTLPLVREGRLQVVIQVCAPLIAYGLKGTIHAILAHEFLHYLELIHRASGAITSDEASGNIRDSVYADGTRVLEPGAVFSDRTLVSHITRRFPAGFRDARLESKTVSNWMDRGLPRTGVDLEGNTAVLPADGLAGLHLEPGLADRLKMMAEKSSRMRGRMAKAASGY